MNHEFGVQRQEVAALARDLEDAIARIHALEEAARTRDGLHNTIQVLQEAHYAGRSLVTQLYEQTETITALQQNAFQLQASTALREAEIDKVNERLRLVERELDQSRRESAAQVQVSRAAVYSCTQPVRLTRSYSPSVCARAVYVLAC